MHGPSRMYWRCRPVATPIPGASVCYSWDASRISKQVRCSRGALMRACLTPFSALRKEDGSYAPAHLLADNRMERAGRRSTDAARAARPPPTSAPGLELTAVGA